MTSSPESNDVARYGLLIVGGNLSHQENYSRALAADPRVRLVGLTAESDVLPRRRGLNQALPVLRRLIFSILPQITVLTCFLNLFRKVMLQFPVQSLNLIFKSFEYL